MPSLSFMPKGVVVYPSNNSRLKGYAFYKDGNGCLGCQGSMKPKKLKGAHLGKSLYDVKLTMGGTLSVMAGKLDKKLVNRVCDPDSGKEIGDFRWEFLKEQDGTFRHRCDSSGEFQVIASTFKKLFKAGTYGWANVHDDVDPEGTEEQTRENFFDALASITESSCDYFAYAGHGMPGRLPSAQVTKEHLPKLVGEIRRVMKEDGTIIFYACSTGVAGGFASKVSHQFPMASVWGHTDSGTASRNADKYRFRNSLGVDIRTLLSPLAQSKFASYLLASSDFYARLPFMTVEAIEAEVSSGGGRGPAPIEHVATHATR